MDELRAGVDAEAQRTGFAGVVRVDVGGETVVEAAYGLADRAHGVPNDVDGQLALASGTKGLTALVVARLIEDGRLGLGTTARSLLGADLPLVDDAVTVEHLLAHRSGIGDYFDESAGLEIDDHVLAVPVHQLDGAEAYLAVLDGYPTAFPPGERFAYCNGGYVLLAILAERAADERYADLVERLVCGPAGMTSTAFFRSNELPGRAAIGYLAGDGLRTNVLHLPLVGVGDGGAHATVADVHRLWDALLTGRILSPTMVAEVLRPRSEALEAERALRYGLGFWLAPTGDGVLLEGSDAGISFRSTHEPGAQRTWTVISNTSEGAWPMLRHLDGALA